MNDQNATARREAKRLAELSPRITKPKSIRGKRLTVNETFLFEQAVDEAKGTSSGLFSHLKSSARFLNARDFEIAAEGIRAVQRARWETLTALDAHAVGALLAKREIEESTGAMPTQKAVKERAHAVVREKFRDADFAPWAPDAKAWSKAFKRAGLDYLPRAVRGKGKR